MCKQILREIGITYRIVNTFVDTLLATSELTKGQYQFLVRIFENPGINQKDLSALLFVDKTTTSKAVNKLILKKYISRKSNPEDKRNTKLFITEKGRDTCTFLKKEEQFVNKIALKGFEKKQLDQLLNSLQEINHQIRPLFEDLDDQKRDTYESLIRQEKLKA